MVSCRRARSGASKMMGLPVGNRRLLFKDLYLTEVLLLEVADVDTPRHVLPS
jgi:hypothetical protein